MAFQLSPGVNVTEIDLTTVVPAVATSDAAIAGVFRWGPIGERILIDSETLLAKRFGKPTSLNAETYYTAASFLSYSNRLWVSRAANTSGASFRINAYAPDANSTVPSNVYVAEGNVENILENGLYVYQTTNSAVVVPGQDVVVSNASYDSMSNTTSFELTFFANTDTSANLYFAYPDTSYTAVALSTETAIVANLANQIVKNQNQYSVIDGNFDTDVRYVAKYPGSLGNSLRVSVCDTTAAYKSEVIVQANTIGFANGISIFSTSIGSSDATITITPGTGETVGDAIDAAGLISEQFSVGDQVKVGNASIGVQYLQLTDKTLTSNSTDVVLTLSFQDPYRLHTAYSSNTGIERRWEFFNSVDTTPGTSDYVAAYGNSAATDELHVVVVDDGGKFTGTPGTILEVYKGLSRATDARNNDGSDNYYKNVINQNSPYIWWANDRTNAESANAVNVASATTTSAGNYPFTLGSDGLSESSSNAFSVVAGAYDMFASAEDIDISLVLQGRPIGGSTSVNGTTVEGFQLANYIIDNICETRKDCIALVSPAKELTLNAFGTEATNLVAWRGAIRSSSYAVIDSGYKYAYDKYNDVYRWVPLNGDIAGLCARTDQTNDAWWSPAGFNRGQIKNVVKLAYNPRKSERDVLYSNGVNPVVTFPGQGTVLYGDKTAQAKPSAFDRINVRRLFIVLEKAISTAAKYSLFEFNDAFTRSQFKNLVTPYLRNIKGRRGITDFLVVCDDTNNTAQVIDSNQFVGDIYIKPARSINFIQLNFVAVGTGVQFSEVVGKF